MKPCKGATRTTASLPTITKHQPQTQNQEHDRMKIVIIYGSANDKNFMQPGRDYMDKEKVAYEEEVISAHRNHAELSEYLKKLNASGEKIVIIAVAGLAAALPGVVTVQTD